MLTGLVPENVYLRLRDIPERDLPPSEWILVNVWEMVYPFKKESELQKKEIFRMREELKQQIEALKKRNYNLKCLLLCKLPKYISAIIDYL